MRCLYLWGSPHLKISSTFCIMVCLWRCPGHCWRYRGIWLLQYIWEFFMAAQNVVKAKTMEPGVRRNLCLGYVWAVFLHGFYDTCAMIGSIRATVVFVIFIVVVFFQVYRLLRRESAADTRFKKSPPCAFSIEAHGRGFLYWRKFWMFPLIRSIMA